MDIFRLFQLSLAILLLGYAIAPVESSHHLIKKKIKKKILFKIGLKKLLKKPKIIPVLIPIIIKKHHSTKLFYHKG